MLEVGDDDDMLEQLESEALADQKLEVLPDSADIAIEPDEDPNAVPSREDFVLLPLVSKLLQAHQSGAQAAAQAMAELRRGLRRAERKLAVLEATTEPAADEQTLERRVQVRRELLEEHSRKRSLGADPVP